MNIVSLQGTDNYRFDGSSYGIGGTVGLNEDVAGGFTINGSKNKMNSEYASVTEQAGIYAGNRGFDIVVANNTDLKGAVIDSTATSDKNTLITGTITFDDIKNKAEYDSSGYGFAYNGERNKDKKEQNILKQGDKGFIPNIPMGSSDEDSSTTKSAIADGTIVLTKPSEQKQDVTQLNRNTQDTLNKLDKIFDKKEIEEKQELAGLFAELSFNAIHDLSKNWSTEQKAMAHAAVGYISAELAGSKSSFSTALAAGVNKFVTEEILKDEKALAHYKEHPEELQWLSAALGATIGQMAGDAGSGASIAASATKNNWLYADEQHELAQKIFAITDKGTLTEQDVKQLNSIMQEAGLLSKENIAMDPVHSENITYELKRALNSIKTSDFIGIQFKTDESIGLDNNLNNFNTDFAKMYYEYKGVNDFAKEVGKNIVVEGGKIALSKNPYGAVAILLYEGGKIGKNIYEGITERNNSKWEQGSSDAALLGIQKMTENTIGLTAKDKIFFAVMQAIKDATIASEGNVNNKNRNSKQGVGGKK